MTAPRVRLVGPAIAALLCISIGCGSSATPTTGERAESIDESAERERVTLVRQEALEEVCDVDLDTNEAASALRSASQDLATLDDLDFSEQIEHLRVELAAAQQADPARLAQLAEAGRKVLAGASTTANPGCLTEVSDMVQRLESFGFVDPASARPNPAPESAPAEMFAATFGVEAAVADCASPIYNSAVGDSGQVDDILALQAIAQCQS